MNELSVAYAEGADVLVMVEDIVNVLKGRDNPYSSILSNALEQRQRYLSTRSDQAQVA